MKRYLCGLIIIVLLLFSGVAFAENKTDGELLYDLGIISGTGNGLEEDQPLLREQLIAILLKLQTNPDTSFLPPDVPTFSDVPINHWAYSSIEHAYALNITSGLGDGKFGLGNEVTYQQAVTFMMKTLGKEVNWTTVIDDSEAMNITSQEGLESTQLLRKHIFDLTIDTLITENSNGVLLINQTNRFEDDKIAEFISQVKVNDYDTESVLTNDEVYSLNTHPIELTEFLGMDFYKAYNQLEAIYATDIKMILPESENGVMYISILRDDNQEVCLTAWADTMEIFDVFIGYNSSGPSQYGVIVEDRQETIGGYSVMDDGLNMLDTLNISVSDFTNKRTITNWRTSFNVISYDWSEMAYVFSIEIFEDQSRIFGFRALENKSELEE